MSTKELIQTMFGYHYWASARLLACAEKVSPAEYFAESDYSHGSLHAILFHMLRTDHVWRHILQDGKEPERLRIEDFPSLEKIQAGWRTEEEAMRAFVDSLSAEAIESNVEIANRRGNTFSWEMWRLLVHVVLHGMQHRSEAAALLSGYGQSPGDLDFIFYS